VSRLYGPALIVIAVIVMCLAIYALPFPGNLVLLGAVALGAVIAAAMIRRKPRAHE
jgi:hypothetical protein